MVGQMVYGGTNEVWWDKWSMVGQMEYIVGQIKYGGTNEVYSGTN